MLLICQIRYQFLDKCLILFSKEKQADFLNSLKRETTKVQTFETFKDAIIKRSNHTLQDRCECPHCQSNNVVKNGHKDNIQRFKCKECRKTTSKYAIKSYPKGDC